MGLPRGGMGEAHARRSLEDMGYRVLDVNYHSLYGEIDIIASREDVLAFVEVKTRREGAMVSGEEAVTAAKRRRIIRTALLYLQDHPELDGLQPRFDVFSVVTRRGDAVDSNYIMGAFDGDG